MVKISASILSADFGNLAEELKKLEIAGTDMIHLDVMDGNFVPNMTFGNHVIKSIRPSTKLPFDVHLMIKKPERYIEDYAKAGADIITIHPEASIHIDRTLSKIKYYGKKAGISLLPSTSPDIIDFIIDKVDLILIMSVNPGFGGQEFIHSQLSKVRILKEKIIKSQRDIILSIDGGINEKTAEASIKAGADMLVSGSFVFESQNYKQRINQLKNIK